MVDSLLVSNADFRILPIDSVTITATTSGTAQLIFTVPAEEVGDLVKFGVTNHSGASADLTMYAVPSGATLGAEHIILFSESIAPGMSADLSESIGAAFSPGTKLCAYASTASAINVRGKVRAWP